MGVGPIKTQTQKRRKSSVGLQPSPCDRIIRITWADMLDSALFSLGLGLPEASGALGDYLTDLFPILELGTSAKMLLGSIRESPLRGLF